MLHVRTGMRSGAYASSCQDTDYAGPGDRQEFGTPVHDERYGLSDIGVCISRFQGRYMVRPWGRRGAFRRLQRPLKPPQGNFLVLEPVIFV
jgi:hypothetical protein